MRIVVALGGNALLKRGEPMTHLAQHTNVRVAAVALADLARDHQIIVAHGNGPQVGLMALQAAAYAPGTLWPLDVLGAETEGMIGYLIEQELMNALPPGSNVATLLTRVLVDPDDPAFVQPPNPSARSIPRKRAKKWVRSITGRWSARRPAACAGWCLRRCRWPFWGWSRSAFWSRRGFA